MENKKTLAIIAASAGVLVLGAAAYGVYRYLKGRSRVFAGDDEDVVYVLLDDDNTHKSFKRKKAM